MIEILAVLTAVQSEVDDGNLNAKGLGFTRLRPPYGPIDVVTAIRAPRARLVGGPVKVRVQIEDPDGKVVDSIATDLTLEQMDATVDATDAELERIYWVRASIPKLALPAGRYMFRVTADDAEGVFAFLVQA